MNKQDSIVITGAGIVSVFGSELQEFWSRLLEGKRPLPDPDYPSGVMVTNWDAEALLGRRGLQYLPRSARFLAGASLLAMDAAKLERVSQEPETLGVVVSANLTGLKIMSEYDYTAISEGPRYVSPMQAPNTLANAGSSHLGTRIKAQALNTTISTGQCAGLDAIGYAARMLNASRALRLVVGGVEELNDRVLSCYKHMGVWSEDSTEWAGRPFLLDSTGWLPGEGAASVILERASSAREREVQPLAKVLSWASTTPLGREERDSGGTLRRAIKQAVQKAGLGPEVIELVISGASGFSRQDRAEASALAQYFSSSESVPICSPKGIMGETYGAGGHFQLITALGALKTGYLPATIPSDLDNQLFSGLNITRDCTAWKYNKGTILLISQDYYGCSSAVVIQNF
ncbi:beta-ketoacyl synthase N-terminal-like domain-containing protein [Ammoniphilus sp. CFH 90114]|uniref:beta-ketoacyl synthase N-terminal-like domain-containing protein n=1 Tax=Ammoniphilus sp. CFH 90114 TaxID=2493665 RepID=UPI00100E68FB|nr:beta-ketoacyl synthase N-terminal-like domain-containing protein [Ammoniphilus sp. CFH 90114]RXT13593.1 hypothetical protein EIZ39_05430 [Ammoniphilus sp. CFH 90114]